MANRAKSLAQHSAKSAMGNKLVFMVRVKGSMGKGEILLPRDSVTSRRYGAGHPP